MTTTSATTARFTISRNALLGAIKPCAEAVAKRTTVSVLSHLLFTVDPEAVAITVLGTDVEMWRTQRVECSISGELSKACQFTAPAAHLLAVIGSLPATPEIEISVNPSTKSRSIKIVCGSAKYEIAGLDPDEMPPVPDLDTESESATVVSVDGNDLAHALTSTSWAMSSDAARPVLEAVMVEIRVHDADDSANAPCTLRFVATDTHNLTTTEAPAVFARRGGNAPSPELWIVPAIAVRALTRFASDCGAGSEVRLSVSGTKRGRLHAHSQRLGAVFTTRLQDGTFPSYQPVIPQNQPCSLTIEKLALTACLSRAMVSGGASNELRVIFDVGGDVDLGFVEVRRRGYGGSVQFCERIEAVVDPPDTQAQWALNVKYFSDAAASFGDCEGLRLLFSEPLRPFQLIDPDEPRHMTVTMPMQIIG